MQIKHLAFVGLLFLFIALGAYFLMRRSPSQSTQLPPSSQVLYRGVKPGETTKEGVVQKLGQPSRTEGGAQKTSFVYPSTQGKRPVLVDAAGNTVVRIIEPLDEAVGFANATKILGAADAVLYGPFHSLGYELHVFLSRGVAILGDPKTNVAWQRRYFEPTTLAQFLAIVAPEYQTEPIPNQP